MLGLHKRHPRVSVSLSTLCDQHSITVQELAGASERKSSTADVTAAQRRYTAMCVLKAPPLALAVLDSGGLVPSSSLWPSRAVGGGSVWAV